MDTKIEEFEALLNEVEALQQHAVRACSPSVFLVFLTAIVPETLSTSITWPNTSGSESNSNVLKVAPS